MKKSLLALAVLGAFSSLAAAQSTVSLFGIVDVTARYVKNDGSGKRKSLESGGLNTSRLGFRGVEDLGGGLRAGFWIEGAMTPDNGTVAGQNWQRRSTVSLLGGFGEVRLGRDFTPTYLNNSAFDPFGNVGVGNALNIARFNNGIGVPVGGGIAAGTTAITFTRSSNSIAYFLPTDIGGVYGNAMVAAGEGAGGRYIGGRVGWTGGPINVAVSVGRQDVTAGGSVEYDTANIGASWNFGFARLVTFFSNEEMDLIGAAADLKERRWLIGAIVPIGQSEIRASFERSDASGGAAGFSANDANLIAVGYVYNLSKRTALYATGSRIDNKGTQRFSVASGTGSPGSPTGGGKSTGFDAGLRHSF